MKKYYLALTFFFLLIIGGEQSFGQCRPSIRIDGNIIIVDENSSAKINLPIWLVTGQTIAIDQNTYFISILEFNTTTPNTLDFSQGLKVTTVQTVPSGKIWKVESVAKQLNPSGYTNITFNNPGTYTWKVPACAYNICIEAWGGGGGGGGSGSSGYGGGGGGGAYGQGCYSVTPGATYTVTVGAAGNAGNTTPTNGLAGGNTSVSSLITANGGSGGGAGTSGTPGAVGGGATTATGATNVVPGQNGTAGTSGCPSGSGGAGGNGGAGSSGVCSGTNALAGSFPGGGGAGGANTYNAGSGSWGKVIITW